TPKEPEQQMRRRAVRQQPQAEWPAHPAHGQTASTGSMRNSQSPDRKQVLGVRAASDEQISLSILSSCEADRDRKSWPCHTRGQERETRPKLRENDPGRTAVY